jgi:peptidoglycan/xylan/chitin deacetylase (PgdA/CDA1 family)
VADSVLLSGSGETAYLAPTFRDAFGNPAMPVPAGWSSDNPSVATVSPDGLISAVAAGSVWIRSALGSPGDSVLVTMVPRGAITITFDDGWDETYDNARPVMESFALRGNVGVITGTVGGAFGPLYMDQPQLQSLHDAGWTLVSHTVTHPSMDTLSNAALDYELRTSRQWLVDQGFGRGADIFIAPYHVFNSREKAAASTYYIAARGTSANLVVPDTMVTWQPSFPFELTGIDMDQLDYTSTAGRAQLRVMLQRTLDEGRFLDILFHKVPAANISGFTATLAVINDFRDRVLPYHELYPQFARPIF